MKFDKSKVCVAGLNEVKEGTKGWFAKNIKRLCDRVERNDWMSIVRSTTAEGFECFEGDLFPFFYPEPEKTYRPFETIEELYGLLGKVISSNNMPCKMIITSVENNLGTLFINNMSVLRVFNNYVFDETGEPVGVEE